MSNNFQMTSAEQQILKHNTEMALRAFQNLNEAFVVDAATPAKVRWAFWQVQCVIEEINSLGYARKNGALKNLGVFISSGELRTVIAPYVPGARGSRSLTELEGMFRRNMQIFIR